MYKRYYILYVCVSIGGKLDLVWARKLRGGKQKKENVCISAGQTNDRISFTFLKFVSCHKDLNRMCVNHRAENRTRISSCPVIQGDSKNS